ncbi:triose phosphate isomerase [Auricularia subglabra TFB-10046 SS5]|nr:triose phosphate isomerase [Auricularia subglabra TFB-10046 SS5]
MARKFFVGGNWKLNPASLAAAKSLATSLNQAELDPNVEVVVSPPTVYLIPINEIVNKNVGVAAQNCHTAATGAFTGEISAAQLVDVNIGYVILGHSERRTLFKETSEIIAKKTKVAVEAGLTVIFCVGETLEEREAGKTVAVVEAQIDAVIKELNEDQWSKIVIAYEPVWAIGTGKVATPEQAQQVHAQIRDYLSRKVSAKVAEATRIIYGGSVSGANCLDLTKRPDIDGFLVGGASLKPEFSNIVNSRKA